MEADLFIPHTTSDIAPRSEALTHTLSRLCNTDPGFYWTAIVDYDGFILASHPFSTEFETDHILAASAHLLRVGERVRDEINTGKWRYTLIAGAESQMMVVALNRECALTVGMSRTVSLDAAFAAIRAIAPDLIRDLDMAKRKHPDLNSMFWRHTQVEWQACSDN
jgi:predicted regulator of Ras-like GTPase activity (Roadblock/LC7/MglB family)